MVLMNWYWMLKVLSYWREIWNFQAMADYFWKKGNKKAMISGQIETEI